MFAARRSGWNPAGLERNIYKVDRIADNNGKDWKGGIIVTVVFGILGILCLIYYGVIVIYSGAGTSFSASWIILAMGFFAAAAVMKFYPRFRDKVPVQLEVAVITFFSAIAFIFVVVELMMGFSSISFQKESVNYVIVLGAQVRGNKISRTLERRLDKAVEYAAYHPNTVFVLSGGQGEDEDVTEASAMYRYMKSRGVPDYQLLLEESSRSTYENMVYSKILITERERLRRATLRAAMAEYGYLLPPDEEITIRVGILTSNFHELRAKGIARHVGIPNVSGISAKSDPVLFAHFCVRECFAILKDKFVGNM